MQSLMATMTPFMASRYTEGEAYTQSVDNGSVSNAMKTYGENEMIIFLLPHVKELIQYLGKTLPDDKVQCSVAQSLLQEAMQCGCKMKELLYFFSLVKRATYGEMTGAFDGVKLLGMFQKHKKARSQSIRRVEEERRQMLERQGAKKSDGLENRIQYLRQLIFARNGDEAAQRFFANIDTTDHYGRPIKGLPWWEDPRSMAELDAEIARLMKVQEEQKTAQDTQKGANEAINPFL